jgi:hypothetical protein
MTPPRLDRPSLRPQPARDGPDFWPTPACLVGALTRSVLPFDAIESERCVIWEPGAGGGAIADALVAAGWDVVATDIEPRRNDILRLDFLHEAPPATNRPTILCGNPPYRRPLLDQFIRRTLRLLDEGRIERAIVLLRIDHFTAGRVPAFNRAATITTCCWRPRWIAGSKGGPRWSFAWVSWDRAGNSGAPLSRFLTPGDLKDDEQLLLPL